MHGEQKEIVTQQDERVAVLRDSNPVDYPTMRRAVATMSRSDFNRLSRMIKDYCGISLPPVKKTMLEGRLRKRLRALGMESFADYCDYLFDSKSVGDEFVHMFDAVTTNKTDFFREPDHFDYLLNRVLPEIVSSQGLGVRRPLNVWSAGCSTGDEVYTLAMVLSEFADKVPGFLFWILGTDISTKVLAKAVSGIYQHERVDPIPMPLRKKYLLRSRSQEMGLVRIAPELRAKVRFERLNLMQEDYGLREKMAVIFCRNVIIYFDRPTQEKLLRRLSQQLITGGYLFVGHSETLHGMELPLVQTSTTVYRKT
ncbi:MAG TPA: protein-glutamate O-methyltransferase CheR [Syntrophobacteraceae bacterium]|nr:protein-glutamate O-methyltransferase CheR [Syntrophobacteraceae bacterium]